jgi:hypothetical protein
LGIFKEQTAVYYNKNALKCHIANMEIKQLLNLLILFFILKQTRWQIKGKGWRKE